MRKGSWYHKTFEEGGVIIKTKIHMCTLWLLTCSQAFFSPLGTWKKDDV